MWDALAVGGQHPRMVGKGQGASAASSSGGPAIYGLQGLDQYRPGFGFMQWIHRPAHGGPPGYAFRVGDLFRGEEGQVAGLAFGKWARGRSGARGEGEGRPGERVRGGGQGQSERGTMGEGQGHK